MPTQLRTGTAAVNSVRDKMPMFVIEKAQNRATFRMQSFYFADIDVKWGTV